ncbi:MAG: aminoglycoside phosphotransferase family protein [Prevotellaceae bacterium]|jgi:Ser/Thr protein kinase RdoA (MazF antagonist)|nr:aminoglycoside phosphotransferase family protein [Prevotellaceae bacterium]
MNNLSTIVSRFRIQGTVADIRPLGSGLINDTYHVATLEATAPDYVLQRINHAIFQDVDMLQSNIEAVTRHIRRKLTEQGADDIDRKVLSFIPADNGKTYWFDTVNYWRLMRFIPRAKTYETVNPEYSYYAGVAFGNFQNMLADIPDTLGETIPNFHNMEFRLQQLREAVAADAAGRVAEVRYYLDELERRADDMCRGERLYRAGELPKRICHCDTKVNNMMFDEHGQVLCVIDLDTVMPNFIFSDFGDFLRTTANTGAEDDRNLDNVNFNMDIFRAFTKGYLESARAFLLPVEIENLPYAAALFPYMQCVRFLADYINGDTYYKIQYPDHNLIRTKAQFKLLQSVEAHTPEMKAFIEAQ